MMQMHQSIKLLCGLVPCASLKSQEETKRKHECSKIQNGDTRQYMRRRMQSFELGFWISDVLVHSIHASSEQIHNHNMYAIMNEATGRGTPFHGCHNLYTERTHTPNRAPDEQFVSERKRQLGRFRSYFGSCGWLTMAATAASVSWRCYCFLCTERER